LNYKTVLQSLFWSVYLAILTVFDYLNSFMQHVYSRQHGF